MARERTDGSATDGGPGKRRKLSPYEVDKALGVDWLAEAYAREPIDWWRFRDWADDLAIKQPHKCILQAIAKHADGRGICKVSAKRIAFISGFGTTKAAESPHWLESKGYIRIVPGLAIGKRTGKEQPAHTFIVAGPDGFPEA